MYKSLKNLFSLLVPALLFFACEASELETGVLEVAIYGEDFVEQGIPAGEVVDGWTIDFDTFEVSIQDASASVGHDMPALTQAVASTYDLTTGSEGLGQLVVSGEVPGGAYDHIGYRVNSLRVSGTATHGEVLKSFSWEIARPTFYGECEGTALVDGATERTQLTIHADHLFYDDLVSSEPNVAFDLMAAADEQGDGNGDITEAELRAIDITTEARYQVGNSTDVVDLWTFIERQSSTVGHIDGEGHCGAVSRE